MGVMSSSIDNLVDHFDLTRITKRCVASVRRDRLLRKGCPFIKIGSAVGYRPPDVEAWMAPLAKQDGKQVGGR